MSSKNELVDNKELKLKGFLEIQNSLSIVLENVNKLKAKTEHPRIFLGQANYCLRHLFNDPKFPNPVGYSGNRAIEDDYLQWLRGQWNAEDRIVRKELERLMKLYDEGVLEIAWSSNVHRLQAKVLAYALRQMRDKLILGHVEMK